MKGKDMKKGSRKLPNKDITNTGKRALPKTTIRPNAPLKPAAWGTGKSG